MDTSLRANIAGRYTFHIPNPASEANLPQGLISHPNDCPTLSLHNPTPRLGIRFIHQNRLFSRISAITVRAQIIEIPFMKYSGACQH